MVKPVQAATDIRPEEVPVSAETLNWITAQGMLSPQAYLRARELSRIAPDAARWRAFLDRALGIGAALLLASAAVFFIAYNWSAMGRFTRLALIEAAVVATCAAGLWLGPRTWQGRTAIFAATALAGGLLAFIGQTYQTGADAWQLFATWAVLALPWAFAAAWSPLWALVLIVANIAVGQWYAVNLPFPFLFGRGHAYLMALTAFNIAALGVAELWGPGGEAGVFRLLPRVAAAAGLGAATLAGIWFFLSYEGRDTRLFFTYAVALLLIVGTYWFVRRDLLLLSLASISAIAVATAEVWNVIARQNVGPAGFLLVSIVIVAMSSAAAYWIRSLARRQSP